MKLRHAFDPDHIRSCTLDIGAHAVKHIGHINHMRLLRRILQDRIPLGKGRCQHNIDGRTDRNHVKINMTAAKMIRIHNYHAMVDLRSCTKTTEALQVLVNRTASDVTAAGQRDLRLFIFSEKRSQQIIGRADPLHVFIIDPDRPDSGSVNRNRMGIDPFYGRTNPGDCLQKHIDIPYIRKIIDHHFLVRHDRRSEDSQSRIFCAANYDIAHQRTAALNHILHDDTSSKSILNYFSFQNPYINTRRSRYSTH